MKTLEEIKTLNETLKKLETVTPDNTGFIIEEGVLIVNGEMAKLGMNETLCRFLQKNKAEIFDRIRNDVRKDISDAKKEYKEHLEKEKEILKGIV